MTPENGLGWYTRYAVNRRSRRAVQSGRSCLYRYYYRMSWERWCRRNLHYQAEEGGAVEIEIKVEK